MTVAQKRESVKTRYYSLCEGSNLLSNAQRSAVSGKLKDEAEKIRKGFVALEEGACNPYLGAAPGEDSTKNLSDELAIRLPSILQEFLPEDQQERLVKFNASRDFCSLRN